MITVIHKGVEEGVVIVGGGPSKNGLSPRTSSVSHFSRSHEFYTFVRLSFIKTERPGSGCQICHLKYRLLKWFGTRTPRSYSFLVVTLLTQVVA